MKPLDYTLYNRVKKKFPPEPGTIVFVSLAVENLEKLEGVRFKIEELVKFRSLVDQHAKDAVPFAAIGGFSEDDVGFNFASLEFEQEEDLLTGEITSLSIGTYNNHPVDPEDLKREMQKFTTGTLLVGNA